MKTLCLSLVLLLHINYRCAIQIALNETEKPLTQSMNSFVIKLYNELGAIKDENFFISPFSVSTALAMSLIGAQNQTAEQLKQLLDLEYNKNQILKIYDDYLKTLSMLNKNDLILNVANKIYAKNGFKINQDFVNNLVKHFRSEIELIDFSKASESAMTINNWVSNHTNNKIKNIIDPASLNSQTKIVLINTLYFNGKWMRKFNVQNTETQDFHLDDGTISKVEMMQLFEKKFNIQKNPAGLNAITCELPYSDSVSMTIILPNKDSSIKDLERNLTATHLTNILSSFKSFKSNLFLPKFNIKFKSDLSEPLKMLGANLPFDSNADFSGICDQQCKLHISKVMHQTFISVDENGTEAAAATAVQIGLTSVFEPDDEEIIEVKCDRPFMFVIHETVKNGVLFIGKFVKP